MYQIDTTDVHTENADSVTAADDAAVTVAAAAEAIVDAVTSSSKPLSS